LKILLAGDGAIGKTCFFNRLINKDDSNDWNNADNYEPTTFNNQASDIQRDDGSKLDVEFWDTAGQESFEQLRKLSYPGTDLYLVGFSHIEKGSLTNIQHKWLPEISESEPDPWFIVIGCKKDLYDGKKILQEDVETQCKSVNACAFVNTSAKEENPDTCGLKRLRKMMQTLLDMKSQGIARPNWGAVEGYLDQVDPKATNAADDSKMKAEEEAKKAAEAKKAEEEAKKAAEAMRAEEEADRAKQAKQHEDDEAMARRLHAEEEAAAVAAANPAPANNAAGSAPANNSAAKPAPANDSAANPAHVQPEKPVNVQHKNKTDKAAGCSCILM